MSSGPVYRVFALALCSLLFFSASAAGINSAALEMSVVIRKLTQGRAPQFTEKPIPVKVPAGGFRRDAKYRGGVWTDQTLKTLEYANSIWGGQSDLLWASLFPQAGGGSGGAGAGGGEPFPWEGYVDVPSEPGKSVVVNTNTGNLKTAEHITSWPSRGMDVDITLYHNSDTNYNASIGKGWSLSYDVQVVEDPATLNAVLRWGDGTAVGYVYEGEVNGVRSFVSPGGIHDRLNKNVMGAPYYTVTQNDGTVYTLGGTGTADLYKLTSIVDRAGNCITVQLNGTKITTVTCPSGRFAEFLYDVSGKLQTIRSPEGREWTLSYDVMNGRLLRINFPLSGNVQNYKDYTYASGNFGLTCLITNVIDFGGREWKYSYNSSTFQAQSSTTPMNFSTSYAFGAGSCTIGYPGGQHRVDNYTGGRLTSVVDPDLFSVQFSLDSDNNVTSFTDQRGKVWSYQYDTRGNMLTATNPLGKTWTYAYNSTNDLTSVTDPLMNQYLLTWDVNEGNLLTVTDPLSRVVMTNTYDGYGQLLTSKNALNQTTTLGYDADGNLITVTDPTFRTINFTYDGMGRPKTVVNANNAITEVVYDASKRPFKLIHPDGSWAQVTYDNKGNVATAQNERGKIWSFAYDTDYRLTSTTNPLSQSETYTLNSNGWVTAVMNGRGYTRNYTYTNRGEVATLQMPDGTSENWSYDGAGNVTLYQNGANGTGVAFEYDNAGRSTKVNYPTNVDTTFAYDNADRLTSMVDATGTTTWSYNTASEVTQTASPQGTVLYTYDLAGRRATMKPSTMTNPYQYAYDAAGRLSTFTTMWGDTVNFTYDNLGRETRRTFSGGHYEDRAYDSRDRLTYVSLRNASGTAMRNQWYTYQSNSNVLTHQVNSTISTYGYDDADQLISETDNAGYAATYQYDGNGNRTQRVLNGVTETYTYGPGDLLSSVTWTGGYKNFLYDSAGNTVSKTTPSGTTTYSYDEEGRLKGIAYPSAATNSFFYNGFRARTKAVDSAGTKNILRDGQDAASPIVNDGIAYQFPGGMGENRSGSTFWLHGNLKNNDVRTSAAGASQSQKTYDAFGNEKTYTGWWPGYEKYGGMSGYQADSDSGLMLLGHRYVDPTLGRFLTRDPIKSSSNYFVYAGNSPITCGDPEGLQLQSNNAFSAFNDMMGPPSAGAAAEAAKGAATPHVEALRGGVFFAGDVIYAICCLTSFVDPTPTSDTGYVAMSATHGDPEGAALGVIAAFLPCVNATALKISKKPAFKAGEWLSHFMKHGEEFGAKNSVEYLRGAQNLVGGGSGIQRHIRRNGDSLFYRSSTNEFGVLSRDGKTIRTYFKPQQGQQYWQRQLHT